MQKVIGNIPVFLTAKGMFTPNRTNVDANANEITRFAFISSESGEGKGAMTAALGPIKISHKKMAAKGGSIDFMFFAPPHPTAGSATVYCF